MTQTGLTCILQSREHNNKAKIHEKVQLIVMFKACDS